MSLKDARQLFAGELEYANVTEFRESLLRFISEFERDPTRRFLVTKHGKPHAVLLSFRGFEVLRKVVEAVLAQDASKDVSQILAEASGRMDREYGVVVRQGHVWPAGSASGTGEEPPVEKATRTPASRLKARHARFRLRRRQTGKPAKATGSG